MHGKTPGLPITNTGSLQTVPLTEALFVQTTGVVQVSGPNTAPINFGTITAGTTLELAITQVGTANTAVLIPLR